MDVGTFFLSGVIGKKPELRTAKNGKLYLFLSVAHGKSYKKTDGTWENQTEWYSIVAQGALAKYISERAESRDTVFVEGALRAFKKDVDGAKYPVEMVQLIAKTVKIVPKTSKENVERDNVRRF